MHFTEQVSYHPVIINRHLFHKYTSHLHKYVYFTESIYTSFTFIRPHLYVPLSHMQVSFTSIRPSYEIYIYLFYIYTSSSIYTCFTYIRLIYINTSILLNLYIPLLHVYVFIYIFLFYMYTSHLHKYVYFTEQVSYHPVTNCHIHISHFYIDRSLLYEVSFIWIGLFVIKSVLQSSHHKHISVLHIYISFT